VNTLQLERALGTLGAYETLRWAEDLFEHRDYYAAARVLQHLVDTHDTPSELGAAKELLARSYYHSAQLGRAIETAEHLLEERPDDAYVALLLARSYERASRPEAAAAMRRARALGAQW